MDRDKLEVLVGLRENAIERYKCFCSGRGYSDRDESIREFLLKAEAAGLTYGDFRGFVNVDFIEKQKFAREGLEGGIVLGLEVREGETFFYVFGARGFVDGTCLGISRDDNYIVDKIFVHELVEIREEPKDGEGLSLDSFSYVSNYFF
jgi:hypothetical protein